MMHLSIINACRRFVRAIFQRPGFQQKIMNKKAGNFPPLSKHILVQRYGYFFEEDSGSEKNQSVYC